MRLEHAVQLHIHYWRRIVTLTSIAFQFDADVQIDGRSIWKDAVTMLLEGNTLRLAPSSRRDRDLGQISRRCR
jgi:hypothetical protein